MPIDSRVRTLLDMLSRVEAPRLHDQPVEYARRNFHKLLFAYRGEAPEGVAMEALEIARRDFAGGPLAARLYKLEGATERLPVFVWLHGGGWTLGDLAGYDVLCRHFCALAGCAVLALDYRLAPENPFPAAVEDVWHCLKWLRREGAALGLDAERIALGGDSAGGNLTAVACLMAREASDMPIRLQVLVYPSTDQTSTRCSHTKYGEGHFLDRASISWFQYNYLPSPADMHDWRASPLLATDFRNLPPALVLTAECDPLTDDAKAYAERLQGAGVSCIYREVEGMIHGFLTMPRLFEEATWSVEEIAAALRAALRN
ncbi:MAG: alpha/beta hydrolase [Rhodocyclaceae bacterium]